ncbi:MAG: DUF1292 domain-containing protein [Dorea sp.]|jgi:hypothetical protein|nr:DUF1292 domain-containing protein [Dorea sp.]
MNDLLSAPENLGTVTLTLENDKELECEILTIYTAAGREYIALAPQDESLDDIVYLYRYIDHGDDEPELQLIEEDEEYEIASDGFDEWLDTMEFEEMV